jgi:hypothetical protein
MKVRLSGALLLVATAALAQAPTTVKSAEQLRALASRAKDSGDLQSDANYLCQAATLDPKKYAKKCNQAKDDANKALAQFQVDLELGRAALQRKDYTGALRDLGKITFGPNKTEAQELMQQARIGNSGGTPIDPVSLTAFKAARDAYFRGDFDLAESQAKRVLAPPLQGASNQILANIGVYRDVMKEAEAMVRSGNLEGAEQKYQFAVTIQQNGPGHPQERLLQVQAAEAQALAAKPQPQPATPVQTAPESKAPQPPQLKNLAKNKHPLETAGGGESQVVLKDALHAHNAALGLNMRQPEADAENKRVLGGMQEDPQGVRDKLTEGVADFYASNFSHAEDAFGLYLQGGGKHYAGAAHFYLGASLLTQAILTSPTDQPQSDALRRHARDQFALAKQLHYKPLKSAVSPKILAQWTQAGGRQ